MANIAWFVLAEHLKIMHSRGPKPSIETEKNNVVQLGQMVCGWLGRGLGQLLG